MNDILVTGGTPLSGAISVVGAKNAVLKQMVAVLLAPGIHHIDNVPAIQDVTLMGEVLRHVGAKCAREGSLLEIDVPDEPLPEAPINLVRQMRASILVLGALLARCGEARVALPGGDNFGSRPIDMHLLGLREMGAEFELEHGVLVATAPDGLHGAELYLDFPSVGATENILLGAVLASGTTTIENAAREPELEDLARFLTAMGARINGAGTSTIVVEGVGELTAADHRVVPDRLEAGTYLLAGAITAGTIRTSDCVPAHLRMELAKLRDTGCDVETGEDWIEVTGPQRPEPVDFATLPYPGFHTDMHPQLVSLLSLADGTSVITENIYESRFRYIGELNRMGADISTEGQHVVIKGVESLSGCEVQAPDIRAGAALVVAALASQGRTLVTAAHHIDRGYEDFVGRLLSVGAKVETIPATGS